MQIAARPNKDKTVKPPSQKYPLKRKAQVFLRLPSFVKVWLIPTWIALAVANMLIYCVPFRRFARLLGEDTGAVRLAPILNARQQRSAEFIRRTIAIAARYAPFRSDCLRQALVTCCLCRLFGIPYALHLGASIESGTGQETGKLKAHAWVISGPLAVCGGGSQSFTALACFVFTKRNGFPASL